MNPSVVPASSVPALFPGGLPGLNCEGPTPTPAGNGSFSRALDQAVHTRPDSGPTAQRLNKPAEDSGADADPGRCQRGERARDNAKEDAVESDDSLAGALAVAAPPPPPQENSAPAEAVTTDEAGRTLENATGVSDAVAKQSASRPASGEAFAGLAPASPLTGEIKLTEVFTPVTPTDAALPVEALPTANRNPLEGAPVAEWNGDAAQSIEVQPDANARATAPVISSDDVLSPEQSAALPLAVGLSRGKEVLASDDPAARVARAARRIRAESVENPRGISTAKMDAAMKNTQKKDEIAGIPQQILPGVQATQVPPLPGLAAGLRRGQAAELGSEAATPDAGEAISFSPVRSGDALTTEAVSGNATPALGRIGELVTREVRMFKRSADDLVEVVLTPDAKTQISLRLQWREGQVEVQARCDFGDHHVLNVQWPQLQAALAGQGVRLSHLGERVQAGLTDLFNNSSFAQSHGGERRPADSSPALETPARPAVNRPAHTTPRSAIRANRLLESWA
jgi:hypothetical protein